MLEAPNCVLGSSTSVVSKSEGDGERGTVEWRREEVEEEGGDTEGVVREPESKELADAIPDESDQIELLVVEVGVVGTCTRASDSTLASSTLASSILANSSSSSSQGKKFLNRASACHLLAFLNSIQTSMRPGRDSAGSRRSR